MEGASHLFRTVYGREVIEVETIGNNRCYIIPEIECAVYTECLADKESVQCSAGMGSIFISREQIPLYTAWRMGVDK